MLCGIEHKTDHLESGNYEMTNSYIVAWLQLSFDQLSHIPFDWGTS